MRDTLTLLFVSESRDESLMWKVFSLHLKAEGHPYYQRQGIWAGKPVSTSLVTSIIDYPKPRPCLDSSLIKHPKPKSLNTVQFSSAAQLGPTRCDPMNHSTPGLPVHHQLLEFTQTHVHRVCDAIQPSHPLSSPSLPALSLSQHQGLFKWVSSSHHVAKVLEFQLQHQSFQWTPRTDLL